jgi:hypothetical protein
MSLSFGDYFDAALAMDIEAAGALRLTDRAPA